MKSLHNIYVRSDRKLFPTGKFNYDDSRLLVNRIKRALEVLPDEHFSGERDFEWKREILWYWYHHAISVAVFCRGDLFQARLFADLALWFQGRNPSNKITRLLWHLVHGRVKQAKRWFREGVKSPDRGTGRAVLHWYKQGHFSLNPERRKRSEDKSNSKVQRD